MKSGRRYVIDFDSSFNQLLVNPKLSLDRDETLREFNRLKPELENHFFLATSGSVSDNFKWVALSREALFASARAVNSWVQASCDDVWLQSLPEFHIGGLSIQARAYLSNSRVEMSSVRWDPHQFIETIEAKKCTLASLVPTQLFDLVQTNSKPPASLRGVFVGGGSLSRDLFNRARELNWPIYVTYGCSEASSQVATSRLNEFEMRPLGHVTVSIENSLIVLQGEALLSGYFVQQSGEWHFSDPKVGGKFYSDDLGELKGEFLKCFGRATRVSKVLGENVNFDHLQEKFEAVSGLLVGDFAIVPRKNTRTENEVVLVSLRDCGPAVEDFNNQVLPFERIVEAIFVEELPKTELGKVRYKELEEKVNKNEF